MEKKEGQRNQNYLTHSLTGNTSGSNNVQTMIDILNQTTVKPSVQSTESNTNQSKKVSE